MNQDDAPAIIAAWLIRSGRGVRIDPADSQPEIGRIISSVSSSKQDQSFVTELAVQAAHEASPDCLYGHSDEKADHSASCKAMAHRLETSYRDMGMTAQVRDVTKIKIMVPGYGYASGRDFIREHIPVDRIEVLEKNELGIGSYIIMGQKDAETIRIIDCKTSDSWIAANGFMHCPENLVKVRKIT